MPVGQIRYLFELIALLRITFPAIRVTALFDRPLLIAAGIRAVVRPVSPARRHCLQMGSNGLALRVQPIGDRQIHSF
ncbi:hypothetical protein D3C72_1667910 [compost metagenome]